MRRARHPEARCASCHMHANVCICALIPRIETQAHLVLVLHQLEIKKPTNTGVLATRCLPNSSIVVRGQHQPVPSEKLWPQTHEPVLLFPTDTARPLAEVVAARPAGSLPLALVVPDGTWSQASRAVRRIPCLSAIQAVTVTADGPSIYRLRTANEPGQVCTLEAIALAFEHLEGAHGPHVRQQLHTMLRIMVERTLWTRGELQASEVTGGIPAGARPDQPWLGVANPGPREV